MQILKVVIVSHDGRTRDLDLRPGALNILTGQSGTGKSSIAEIIDYCFGASECDVSVGPLRDKVAWYGLLLEMGEGQSIIARECPPVPQKSSEACFLAQGRDLTQLLGSDFVRTTNTAGLRSFLSEALGLGEYQGEQGSSRSQAPTAVSFRHALALCLQTQSEIAQKKYLLHGASDNFVAQALKDTLPYFLGVTSRSDIAKRQKLRERKTELRKARILMEAATSALDETTEASRAMLVEARAVGLLGADVPTTEEVAVALLTGAIEEGLPSADLDSDARQVETEIDVLYRQRAELLDVRALRQDEVDLLDAFSSSVGGYGVELEQQVSRLRSLGLANVSPGIGNHCALCAAPLEGRNAADTASELQDLLESLESRFVNSSAGKPRVAEERDRLVREISEIDDALRSLIAVMERVRDTEAQVGRVREGIARKALVYGRITKFLEDYRSRATRVPDVDALARLESEVRELEKSVSDAALRERLASALSRVARALTTYAQQLRLEHSEDPVRFDLSLLQVVVDTKSGPISMRNMGSGENWIGYHIAAHLALHDRFISAAGPVPRFLVLDQPSQVYFPEGGASQSQPDVDLAAVERLYELLKDFVAEHSPHFQIIVTDHANLKHVDWFQEALVEVWRGGDAFVPDDWPSVKG